MHDILTRLAQLRRPRLLMRAARIGAENYCRSVHLPRFLGYGMLPGPGPALSALMEAEDMMNLQRLDKDAHYMLSRHVDILIALVAEARLLAAHDAGRNCTI